MIIPFVFALCCVLPEANWPAFRGHGNSLSAAADLPLTWADDQGIAWRAELPGYGQSSPVVWGDRAFITAVSGPQKEEALIVCLDVASGKILWKQTFAAATKITDSDYVSRAAPTPAVDADRVYAFFESGDVVALDHNGKEQWHRKLTVDYGDFQGNHGIGSSLALAGDRLIVLIDHDGPSYLLALDVATGKNHWKIDRPSKISWSSPIFGKAAGRDQIVVSSSGTVESFDPVDGKQLWSFGGIEGNTVASPTLTGDLVLVGSSDGGNNFVLRANGNGSLPADAVVWRSNDAAASFSSPLVHRDRVYLVNKAGVASCLDLRDGKKLWAERIGSCWASPLGAGDRVYFFGKDGVTTVLAAEPEFKKLAENTLTIDGRLYGAAVVPGAFLLRSGNQLICVGKPDATTKK
jgi:outer membrane protein assembly factor BamB